MTAGRSYGLAAVVVVILAIVVTEFVVIAAQTAPRPALSSASLSAVVPADADGKPSLTWTNASPDAEGRPSRMTAEHFLLAAACTGGGALSITLSAQTSVDLDCSTDATAGPLRFDRGHASVGAIAVSAITVRATAGNPRYVVTVIAMNA